MASVERVSPVPWFSDMESLTGFISSDIVGLLRQNLEFRCRWCGGLARPIEEKPQTMVTSSCWRTRYGVLLSWRCNSSWWWLRVANSNKNKMCLGKVPRPSLVNHIPSSIFKTRGRIYDTYMRPVLTYASKFWATTVDNFAKITKSTLQQINLVWTCSLKSRQHRTCRWQNCN